MKGFRTAAVSAAAVLGFAVFGIPASARSGSETTIAFDLGKELGVRKTVFRTGRKNRLPGAPRRPGFRFDAWVMRGPDGTRRFLESDAVSDELVRKIGDGTVLKAVWVPVKPVLVRFDLSGGSGSVPSKRFVYDSKNRRIKGRVSKSGFRFAGWSSSKTESGIVVRKARGTIPNSFILKNAGRTVVLHAVWKEEKRKRKRNPVRRTVIRANSDASGNSLKAFAGNGFEITFFASPDSDAVARIPKFADLMREAGFTVAQLKIQESTAEKRARARKAVDELAERNLRVRLISPTTFVVRPDRKSAMSRSVPRQSFPSTYASSVVSELAGKRNVVGFFIADEPRPSDVGLASGLLNDVARACGKKCEANLFSNYGTKKWRGGRFTASEYDDYLKSWAKSASGSEWLSAANYPGARGDFSKSAVEQFFDNVVSLLETARKYGKKPILITGTYGKDDRALGKREIAFQIAACLSLGMKGLDWYTFRRPDAESASGWLAESDASPTKTFRVAKTVNAWAYSVGSELYGRRIVSAYELGNGSSRKLFGNGKAKDSAEVLKGRILASVFEGKGGTVLVFACTRPKGRAELRLNGLFKATVFSPLENGGRWMRIPNGVLDVLDGDGDSLFKIDSDGSEIEIPSGGIVLVKPS